MVLKVTRPGVIYKKTDAPADASVLKGVVWVRKNFVEINKIQFYRNACYAL